MKMAIRIDGKETSRKVRGEIAKKVQELKEQGKVTGLAVVIVGENPASQVYVRNKAKACEEVGMYSEVHALPESTTEEELLALVERLNHEDKIDGILVQLPLPKHINEERVILAIDPNKDVDAFHPVNTGKIMIGNYEFLPCTPAGVMTLLKEYNIEVEGKECVVVGRSNIVGKPQALLLLQKNGTVTVCHSRTKNLAEITRRADILVVAIGKAEFITGDMIKEGAVVIDVGMNRKSDGKLCGDVEFASASEKASYITPVPGGVGPMTITTLLQNTLVASEKRMTK
ncbi:MAG: bifunctional methylenetetrahydrofolate dehydrogenase/methenyltetrahydrofolate cyclohydrolase FolD [Clostridia bacterium]|nr:bifunctional methylenetetrahydrofolate dehydrogenase/methenyltetrahydrofolate cyclohydrolase FolD [Clostridia bacterium]